MADWWPCADMGAPGPIGWLSGLQVALAEHRAVGEAEDPVELTVLGTAELLADDAAVLRGAHARLVAEGTTPQAAATYLAGWFAGGVAELVALGLAVGRAGFRVRAPHIRWHLHPDGWPQRIVLLDAEVEVAEGHPWAGRPGVGVVPGPVETGGRAVTDLVAFATPVVSACRGLARRVGLAGLWAEVADGLGSPLAYQDVIPVTEDLCDILRRALATPGVPWRAVPRLAFATAPAVGSVHVVQKGGCCLSFTCPDSAEDDHEVDPEHQAWLARFPHRPGEKRYCSTCRFRDPADTEARQLYWAERRLARAATRRDDEPAPAATVASR
ncbi:MAG: hypothetical protein ACT4NY_19450 [Pseudonocardiales bacterium]